MSKAAEEAHERWSVQHDADCARYFTMGAKVYRASKYSDHGVEEGAIVRIRRCYFAKWSSSQQPLDDGESPPSGERVYPLYTAEFGRNDTESQTMEARFYHDARHAHAKQARNLAREIKELEGRIEKLRREAAREEGMVDGAKMEWRW